VSKTSKIVGVITVSCDYTSKIIGGQDVNMLPLDGP